MTLYEYDRNFYVSPVCGIDEAGRGPLAGPVYAAAVILDNSAEIAGLNDSKKLSEIRREKLYDEIVEKSICYSVAFATVEEIDEINILQAAFLAMKRAAEGLSVTPKLALVDGNLSPGLGIDTRTIIKGDSLSASIAAASILAKVSRDRYMIEIDGKYPGYDFARHKGYCTAAHLEAIRELGLSAIHRKTFRVPLDRSTKSNINGKIGEQAAAKFLQRLGYRIIKQNYSVKVGEIDIIAADGDVTVFVEVKTRQPDSMIQPWESVTKAKQRKIIRAAQAYICNNNCDDTGFRFDVIEIMPERGKFKVRHIKSAFDAQ